MYNVCIHSGAADAYISGNCNFSPSCIILWYCATNGSLTNPTLSRMCGKSQIVFPVLMMLAQTAVILSPVYIRHTWRFSKEHCYLFVCLLVWWWMYFVDEISDLSACYRETKGHVTFPECNPQKYTVKIDWMYIGIPK